MNELKPKVLTLLDDKFTFLIPTDLFWTQLLEVLILVIFPKFIVPNIILITLEHILFSVHYSLFHQHLQEYFTTLDNMRI